MFTLDRRLFVLLSALSFAACRGDDPGGSESSSTTAASDSNSSTGGTPTTTAATSSSGGGESSTTGDPTTSTTDNSAGFITTATTTNDTNTGPKPNGSMCASDDECVSMNCFSVLGMGFCADCNEDQDCVDAGTGTACTLDAMSMNAICTDGQLGSSCMSDEACAGGKCGPVIDIPIPGIIPDLCNECDTSADCMDGKLCSPVFDIMAFSGQKSCVEPGSVENNNLCTKGPDGPMVCKSSHCTSATIMGIVELFICGECDTDMDCAMGQTCNPAEASMNGFSGSVCA